jgi:hypothetical protein
VLTNLNKIQWEDEEDGFMYPKVYNLFHTSQVEILWQEVENEFEIEMKAQKDMEQMAIESLISHTAYSF